MAWNISAIADAQILSAVAVALGRRILAREFAPIERRGDRNRMTIAPVAGYFRPWTDSIS
jgi:hypothetical protein